MGFAIKIDEIIKEPSVQLKQPKNWIIGVSRILKVLS